MKRLLLEFVSYGLGEPKYRVQECHQRGMTFAAPLKVTIQLVIWEVDLRRHSIDQERQRARGLLRRNSADDRHGTFMVNGTERVIVSQLHRSPGVFFDHDKGKPTPAENSLFCAYHSLPRLVDRF